MTEGCNLEVIHPYCDVCGKSSGSSYMYICRSCGEYPKKIILCCDPMCTEKHMLKTNNLKMCKKCGKYHRSDTLIKIDGLDQCMGCQKEYHTKRILESQRFLERFKKK
jgi:ribosomal protein L32